MNVAQLRDVLVIAEAHYRADGKTRIADGLAAFASNLLDSDDDEKVSSLVKRIKEARRTQSVSRSQRTRQRKKR